MSRGAMRAGRASTIAALVAMSPCAGSRGGSTVTPPMSRPAGSRPSATSRPRPASTSALPSAKISIASSSDRAGVSIAAGRPPRAKSGGACAARGGGVWSGMRAALLALVVAAPAWAQGTLAPGDFAALAEGHTLHFSLDGAPFGAEQYFAGARSLWRFEDGRCEAGTWRPAGDLVCFSYGEGVPAQCWRFRQDGGGLAAALVEGGAETGLVLRMSRRDEAPLDCPGPDVGS